MTGNALPVPSCGLESTDRTYFIAFLERVDGIPSVELRDVLHNIVLILIHVWPGAVVIFHLNHHRSHLIKGGYPVRLRS